MPSPSSDRNPDRILLPDILEQKIFSLNLGDQGTRMLRSDIINTANMKNPDHVRRLAEAKNPWAELEAIRVEQEAAETEKQSSSGKAPKKKAASSPRKRRAAPTNRALDNSQATETPTLPEAETAPQKSLYELQAEELNDAGVQDAIARLQKTYGADVHLAGSPGRASISPNHEEWLVALLGELEKRGLELKDSF